MVEPSDVHDLDLAARITALEERQAGLVDGVQHATKLLGGLMARVAAMADELQTRRLVIVDSAGRERIVAGVGDEVGGARLELIDPGGYRTSVQPHMVEVCHQEGARAHLLVTADDAEVHVQSGPSSVREAPEAARVTLHALRGVPDVRGRVQGRAAVDLATSDGVGQQLEVGSRGLQWS